MNTPMFFKKLTILGAAIALSAGATFALGQDTGGQQQQAQTDPLQKILNLVDQESAKDARINRQREQEFRSDEAKQAQMLADAKKEREHLQNLASQKEKQFEANEAKVSDAQKRLKDRLGTLSELFGHLTSFAGDMRSNFENSIISAQYPGRIAFLDKFVQKLSQSSKLPSIDEIQKVVQMSLKSSYAEGQVVKFKTKYTKANGDAVDGDVIRIGPFNVVTADGKYLKYDPKTGLSVLARQPAGLYLGWADDLAHATSGMHPFGIDPTGPSGGSYLAALIASPDLVQRWHQGGYVGYAITVLGILAILVAIWRIIVLTGVSAKVNAQLKSDKANANNPLGRVLKVFEDNPNVDSETLELKLNEAVLKEIPNLEKYLGLLKIIAAVGPLMGLLGTVTGMINTFQAITIFGAGDPKAMAGGISQALVTTVLGLVVAIPVVLLHTWVSSRSNRIIHIIEEQAAGIIAEHTEAELGKG